MEIFKVEQPISTSDLRKLIQEKFSEPDSAGSRHTKTFIVSTKDGAGWMVIELEVTQSIGAKQLQRLAIVPYVPLTPVLLTYRGRPKVYKTLDALYRDIRAISGLGGITITEFVRAYE